MANQFDSFDIEELAAHLCEFAEDEDYDTSDIDVKLMEEFNLDLDNFYRLIKKLEPLIDMGISPLTEEAFIGFGTGQMWIAKKKYPNFINQVLIWMEFEKIKKGKARGLERTIDEDGKPEFKVVLMAAEKEWAFKEDVAILDKPQYFLMMTDDHRAAKNKLHEEIRKQVRATFNQTLTSDIPDVCRHIESIINACNSLHKRSDPAKGEYWERDHYPNSSDCYYMPGLFQLVFHKVKEVTNG
jgi:hypothetical protein